MKTVKVKFTGVAKGFEPEWNEVYNIMKRHYDVQIVDENPDYILCDSYEPFYEYVNDPQIRILVNGENYVPDFNLVDYSVSRYPITYADRNFYFPGCVYPLHHWLALPQKNRDYDVSFVQQKEFFANFICSHESEGSVRGDFFKKLCEYKRVESPGTYLNNMEEKLRIQWNNDSKTNFQRKCKFTLCFESTVHYGFITEKITDAFYADTIPVYYGSSNVKDIFNDKAFINCADYESFDAVIEKIKELDQDDEKYLEMMRQPILVDPKYPQRILDDLDAYVRYIVDQPLERAYRRSRVYMPSHYEQMIVRMNHREYHSWKVKLKKAIKKIIGRT